MSKKQFSLGKRESPFVVIGLLPGSESSKFKLSLEVHKERDENVSEG